jgi:hypothetical protein
LKTDSEKVIVISQEVFDVMVDDAIDDLRKAGLSPEDIYIIVENHFGEAIAQQFCEG